MCNEYFFIFQISVGNYYPKTDIPKSKVQFSECHSTQNTKLTINCGFSKNPENDKNC